MSGEIKRNLPVATPEVVKRPEGLMVDEAAGVLKKDFVQAENKQDKRKSLPHLFKPGQSGNPEGRPKGKKLFTTQVREALEGLAKTQDGKEMEIKVVLAKKIVQMALAGNEQMIKLMWNYLDGLPNQSLSIEDPTNKYFALREHVAEKVDKFKKPDEE